MLLLGSIFLPARSPFNYWKQPLNMRMHVFYLDCHEAGLVCYIEIHVENLLRPLQLFYFHLWPIYWFSLVWESSQCWVKFAKPGLTHDLNIAQKEEFSITRSTCSTFTWQKAKHIHKRQTHFMSEHMLHNDHDSKDSAEKKIISGRDTQGAWRQDELIGGKPPVAK
jgi:predicted transposase YbfD/YdcC